MMNDELKIEAMTAVDWPDVSRIYAEGIATGDATFETAVPPWETWNANHRADCRFVARNSAGQILGWAALTPISSRCVYEGVAEVSVYVGEAARGQGLGKMLLQALVTASETTGTWTLQSSITPENKASIAIHERCGFRIVGHREKIAQHNGRWRDTVLMERRSILVGIG